MTRGEATRILQTPKFGDPSCIEAVKLLELEEEADALRLKLLNQRTKCWCCQGCGQLECAYGCHHTCPTCDGSRKATLMGADLRRMDILDLRKIAQELSVEA